MLRSRNTFGCAKLRRMPLPPPIAFVTDEVPRPGQAGHLAVNHAILSYLAARGHDIVVLVRPRLPWPVQIYGRALDPGRIGVVGPGLLSGPACCRAGAG